MNSSEKYYVEKVASVARETLINDGIINSNIKKIDINLMGKIVDFFGGKLIRSDDCGQKFTFTKIGENSFEIHYNNNRNFILRILHELGHAFFDLEDMQISEQKRFDDRNYSDLKADLFARAFLMPRENFEKTVADSMTKDGSFDMEEVAKEYGVSYIDVLERGEDLNLW